MTVAPRDAAPYAPRRGRIEQAIRELDYRPNQIAQALRGAGTHTVGLLLPSAVNRFFGELANAIEEALFLAGLTLTVGYSDDDAIRESRYIDTFLDHRVDGILAISSQSSQIIERTVSATVPVIMLDRVPLELQVSSVTVDNRTGVEAAVGLLVDHGHTRIACICGRIGTESADARVAAWEQLVATPNLDATAQLLARADFTEEGGYAAMREILERSPNARPSAVFVSSDI